MANETTTTTLAESTYSAVIEEEALMYLEAVSVLMPLCRRKDISGEKSMSAKFHIEGSFTAASKAETGSYSNQAYTTSSVTITASEVGVQFTVTDPAELSSYQDSVDMARRAGEALTLQFDQTVAGLFTALNGGTAVGTSGSDLTVANFLQAKATVRLNNAHRLGEVVCVLHEQQISDLENNLISLTGTVLTGKEPSHLSTDKNGYAGTLFNVPIYGTNNCPLVNSNADRAGAMFVKEQTFAYVVKWDVKHEEDRDISMTATKHVVHWCYGAGELQDKGGVAIVTDA